MVITYDVLIIQLKHTLNQVVVGAGVPWASQGNETASPILTYITSGGFNLKCGGAKHKNNNIIKVKYN